MTLRLMKTAAMATMATFLVLGGPALSPALAGDVDAGAKVFKKCKACHWADKAKNKTGPYLVGIIGRTAGTLDSYKKYSKAMKESGIVWDEATLTDYLRAPKKYLKGTKMAFAGLKKDADIENVIAYLKAQN